MENKEIKTGTKVTTDHDAIRKWAEQRGGRPATVMGTGDAEDPGMIRVDFGEPDSSLVEISWEDFFNRFEENNLAFLYQENTAEGKSSRFNKFISRDTAQELQDMT